MSGGNNKLSSEDKLKFKLKILSNCITENDLTPKTPGSAGIDLLAVGISGELDGGFGFTDAKSELFVELFYTLPRLAKRQKSNVLTRL